MSPNRLLADEKCISNHTVAFSFTEMVKNLNFSLGKIRVGICLERADNHSCDLGAHGSATIMSFSDCV